MLEVLASFLLMTAAGIMGWSIMRIIDHEKRIITIEIKCNNKET